MRVIGLFLVLLIAGCGREETPAASLDDAARDYVRLVLEIGAHEDGYIDAYFGAPEWKQAADANPRSIAELKSAADALHATLSPAATTATNELETRRAYFLQAHVASARFRLDMIEGAKTQFADEAERLFALRPVLQPLESYDPVVARIEALVPGDGLLSDRVEAFRTRYAIPRQRLQSVMDAAIAECRRRTRAHLVLPDDERFTLEFVTGQNWGAYNWYQGNNRSLIQINTDLPIFIDRALGLACHEGYPGHHIQGLYRERLYRMRGWVEFSVLPLYAPVSPLLEGAADFGVDLAFPGQERLRFEAEQLYPLAGLDPAGAPAYDALRRALVELAGARLTVAAMLLDGEIDREKAIELAQRYQLASRARVEPSIRFTETYRSYVINYAVGEELVRNFVEMDAADEAGQWLAFERILSEPTLPVDLTP